MMIWVVVGVVCAGLAIGFAVWRIRKRRRHRLISFVALTRVPTTFDPAVLASVAGRAWDADLGDGSSEGRDGFVACTDVISSIMHDGRMFLINSFPRPYVDDVDEAADSIADLRIRTLFREHAAWFSCDALGVDGTATDDDVRDWYRRLGTLFAELFDDNCLLIYVPDSGRAYPINEDTEAALRSNNPLRALQETLTVPVVEVGPDDPLMQQAVASAHEHWPDFVAAFEARQGENFAVKAPVSHDDVTEFIWIGVTALEGGRVYGELANDPANLGPLRLGSKVNVPESDLNDWCFVGDDGALNGGFTIEAVQKAAQRGRRKS